jgi:hypothetical protein
MAKILTFRTSERRDDDSTAARTSAQVIVFPGVRYEHWEQSGEAPSAAAPATAKPSHDRRRDVLELAE